MQAFEQAWCEFCCREPSTSTSDGSVRLLLDQPGGTASYGQCVDTFSLAGWTLLVTVQLDGSVALWATACLRQRRRFFWDASNERLVDDQVNVSESMTASGTVLSVRFRSPDAALIVGTRSGHVICIDHEWSAGRPHLYGRWRLLAQLTAPVWLVGVSTAPAALPGRSAQAAGSSASRSSAPSPSPVDSSIVMVAWTTRTLWWQTTPDETWQSYSLSEDLKRDLNELGDDAATVMYIGECAPSGRFFAWTYRGATVCWIHVRPGTEGQPPEKVFRISSREPLYSLGWKPAPIRGCDVLLLGDLRGRLMLFRPDLESTEGFVAVATTPPISETKIPLAVFVHQYATGGIAEDEEDAAWTILTAWRLARTRPAETTTCSTVNPPETIRSPNVNADAQALGPMVHPRRISHAVHFVGQFTGDDTFLWRVSHLNDEPFPRAVQVHPPTELVQKLGEHLMTSEHHHESASCSRRDSATTSPAVSLALRIEAADPSRPLVNANCAPAKALRSPRPPAIPSQLNWFLQQGQTLKRWYQNGRPGDGLSLWSHAIVLGPERSTPFVSLFYSPERQSLVALTTAHQLVWWPLPSWSALATGYAFRSPRLDGPSVQSSLQWLLSAPCLVSGPSPHRRDELAFLTISNAGILSVFAWSELSLATLVSDEVAPPVMGNADAASRSAPSPYPCVRWAQTAAFACVLVAHVPPGVTLSTCSVCSQPRSGENLDCSTVVGLLCWSATLMEWSLGTVQAADTGELPERKSMSATPSANAGELPAAQREQGPQCPPEMPSSGPPDGCIGAAEKLSSSFSATIAPVTGTTPRPYRVSSWQRVVYRAAPPRLLSIRTDKVFVWRMDGMLAVYQLRMTELLLQLIAEVPSALSLVPEQTQTARYRMIVSADAEELAIWDSAARCLHFWSFDGATIYKVTSVEMPRARPDPDISFAQYNGQSYAVVDHQLLRRVAAHWFPCGELPTSAHHVVALPEGFLGCSRHDHLFVLDARALLEAGDRDGHLEHAKAQFESLLLTSIGAGLSASAALELVENLGCHQSSFLGATGRASASETTNLSGLVTHTGSSSDALATDTHLSEDAARHEANQSTSPSPAVISVSSQTDAEHSIVHAFRLSLDAHKMALEALDENGATFLVLADMYRRLGRSIPPEIIQCAMHSTCEEAMLEELGLLSGTTQWQTARQFACGYWVQSPNLIRRLVETIARASYMESRQPRRAVLWYVLLRRPGVLSALFRATGESKIAAFFAQNFADPTTRLRANKNAFAMLARHEYELAAAFFILSNDLTSAMQVIGDRLEDEQLALLISRLEPTWSTAEAALERSQIQPANTEWRLLHEWLLGNHERVIGIVQNMDWFEECTQLGWPRKLAAALLQTRALAGAPSLQRRQDLLEAAERLRIRVGHVWAHAGVAPLAQRLVHRTLRPRVLSRALGQRLLSERSSLTDSAVLLEMNHTCFQINHSRLERQAPMPIPDLSASLLETGRWLLYQTAPVVETLSAWIAVRGLLATDPHTQHATALDRRFVLTFMEHLIAYTAQVVLGTTTTHEDTNQISQQIWLMDAAVLAERFASHWCTDIQPAYATILYQVAALARFLWVWQQASWTPMNAMHASWHHHHHHHRQPPPPTTTRITQDEHASTEAPGSSAAADDDDAIPAAASVPPMPWPNRPHCLRVLHACCLLGFLDRWADRMQSIAPPWAMAMRALVHAALERASVGATPTLAMITSGATRTARVTDGDQEAVHHLWRRCWQAGGWLRTQLARALLADRGTQGTFPATTTTTTTMHRYEPSTFPVRFAALDVDVMQRSSSARRHRRVLVREATLMTALVVSPHEPTWLVVATLKPHRGLCELHWPSSLSASAVDTDEEPGPVVDRSDSSDSVVVRELRAGNWHGRAFESGENASARALRWRSETLASSLAAHPSSNRYVSGDVEGALHFWAFGEPISLGQLVWPLSRNQVVQRVCFAPLGDAVVAAYASGLVALWRVPDKLAMHTTSDPERVWRPFGEACIHDVCFIDEAHVIATFGRASDGTSAATPDGVPSRLDTVRVFDMRLDGSHCRPVMSFRAHSVASADPPGERPSAACESLCGLVLSDRTRLLSASSEGHIAVCDMRTAHCAAQFKAHPDGSAIRCLTMEEPRARALITGTESGHVRLWDARTLRLLEDLGAVHQPTRHFRARARASQHASSLRLSGGTTLFGLYGVECALLTDYSLLTGGGDGYLYAHGPGWSDQVSVDPGPLPSKVPGETQALLRRVQSGLFIA